MDERPKGYTTGGEASKYQQIIRYQGYLIQQMHRQLTERGLEEKLHKYIRTIEERDSLEGLDALAAEWLIPKFLEK